MITKVIGILLILLGTLALFFRRITYVVHQETVTVGRVQRTLETRRVIPLPRVLGVLSILGGVLLVAEGKKLRSRT